MNANRLGSIYQDETKAITIFANNVTCYLHPVRWKEFTKS